MKSPMNIALLARGFNWGGGAELLRLFARALLYKGATTPLRLSLLVPKGGLLLRSRYGMLLDYFDGMDADLTIRFHEDSRAGLISCLKDTGADVALPTYRSLGRDFPVPWVGYIYDFQHLHYPGNFSVRERLSRDAEFSLLLHETCSVIVNAGSVKEDIHRFYPFCRSNVFNLPFAAAPAGGWLEPGPDNVGKKYGLPDRYFIISNQFWVHKSHATAFEALAELIRHTGEKMHIVCTGKTVDSRFPGYFSDLKRKVAQLGINENVRFLGHIPKLDQIRIMKKAVAVLQPTLFEGGPGGGSVYDAVALGVPAIVSDIPVNKEINEDNVYFFKAGDAGDMVSRMLEVMGASAPPSAADALVKAGEERILALGGRLLEAIDFAINGGFAERKRPNFTVHALVTSDNRLDDACACLDSLYRQSYGHVRVVYVDDGSADSPAKAIKEKYPTTELTSGGGDTFRARAVRTGLNHILKTANRDDFVLILEDGACFDEDYIDALVDASLWNRRAVAVSVCKASGSLEHFVDGAAVDCGFFLSRHITRRFGRGEDRPDAVQGLSYILGHGILIPVEVFDAVGVFAGEELSQSLHCAEFTCRAGKAGFGLVASTRAVLHIGHRPAAGLRTAGVRRVCKFTVLCIPHWCRIANRVAETVNRLVRPLVKSLH